MSNVEISVKNEFNNKLLDRIELVLTVKHPKASFKKESVKSFIQKKYNTLNYVCSESRTEFGKTETVTKCRVYKNKEQFEKIEDFHVLHKVGLKEKTKDPRRVRKDKRKRKVLTWGTQRRQDRKSERKQK
ncbi:hypothetical protein M153_12152000428 [Pseudoloma neurophilia]|uniref:40S ribosomal protein S24 n=1 Tax=Pseudoloma neurophilia TaxID=146866 RepID=A0A0R0LXD6_9MICR|nr:hypothetical protein M153_12152000428 [Pseudoloma neurophilia]